VAVVVVAVVVVEVVVFVVVVEVVVVVVVALVVCTAAWGIRIRARYMGPWQVLSAAFASGLHAVVCGCGVERIASDEMRWWIGRAWLPTVE
jgi:hypothetical protein